MGTETVLLDRGVCGLFRIDFLSKSKTIKIPAEGQLENTN